MSTPNLPSSPAKKRSVSLLWSAHVAFVLHTFFDRLPATGQPNRRLSFAVETESPLEDKVQPQEDIALTFDIVLPLLGITNRQFSGKFERNVESRKQSKARNAEKPRSETLTFRLSKQLRSLAEVAARKKGVTLANHVETALKASLDEPIDFLRGASIASVADDLYDEDEAICFLKRLKKYLWAMSPEQKRLLDLIHTSPACYPSFRVYNTALITQHWPELSAVAAGTADVTLLPPDIFDGIDVEFALMSKAERIALYQKDPEGCARRTQDYLQRTRRPIPHENLK